MTAGTASVRRLENRVIVITGAGSGIGSAAARLLAEEGAAVVLVGRRAAALEAVAEQIEKAGGSALAHAADISDVDEVRVLVETAESHFGPVDILVNNAGRASEVLNARWMTNEDWAETVSLNLTAVFQLTRAVLPSMIARGGGSIVTVSSLAADRPNLLGGPAYGAAKAGVRNFMGYLHNTYRNQMIRATTILPGETNTPIMDLRARPPKAEERAVMLDPDDVAAAIHLCCTLPARAVIEELKIAPTFQRNIEVDLEVARWLGVPGDFPDAPK
ncbi:MAG: SDR family oxidoreductase [Geminicoccaceae bacterium]|nr:SDR family oxidoreductase [Geminicoccaceae bacterium]